MYKIETEGTTMKRFIIISLLTSVGVANAAVFKCESSHGSTVYQETPCNNQDQSKKLTITPIDAEKVKHAQEKLAIELEEREKLEAQRAEAAAKERELRVKELGVMAERDLANETRKHSKALADNTKAVNRNSNGRMRRVFFR